MLPRESRLTSADDFRRAFRTGGRGVSAQLLVFTAKTTGSHAPRVGFVVSKAVGGAVVRNRVKRRLRALMRTRLADLSAGELLVIRALPAAADASFDELSAALDSAHAKAIAKREAWAAKQRRRTSGGLSGGGGRAPSADTRPGADGDGSRPQKGASAS